MRRFLQRVPSLLVRNFLHSPTNFRHYNNTNLRLVPPIGRCISLFAFFSSEPDSTLGPKSDHVISTQELKKRIQSFLDDGDEDALPDLFEAMMNRKLSGNHDESDDEVMMEVVRKYPVNDAHKVDNADSDIETDGLGDGDSSDSDTESDGLRDGDSSDSDIESNDLRDGESTESSIVINSLKNVGLSDRDIKIIGLKADPSSDSGSKSN